MIGGLMGGKNPAGALKWEDGATLKPEVQRKW